MLHLILGQSGTGKTTKVLEEIKSAVSGGKNILFIVPEHASFEMERQVCAQLPPRQAMQVSVLSFPRLAENIFRDCGGLSHRALDDMSRIVIMRTAIDEVQDSLKTYRRQSAYGSFLSTMLDTVQEWKRAGITADGMERLIETQEESPLRAKLMDIQLIYAAYQSIVERSFHDPLDELALASRLAGEHNWFAGREVWIDGFDYFSVAERGMIDVMLGQCDEITFAMTADGLDARQDIFVYQKKFLHRLLQSAAKCGIKTARPLLLEQPVRFQNDDLALMQQAFLGRADGKTAEGDAIRILRADNAYEEVQDAAAEILRLVREENYRYRDIAILCRDLDRYGSARFLLEQYGIPYFSSEKDRLIGHALPGFLCAALEAAAGNFRTESMLQLARSAAFGLTPQQAGNLENYCYIWSVAAAGWLVPFTNNPEGMSDDAPEQYAAEIREIDKCRALLAEPVAHLKDSLQSGTGSDFAKAIYTYICETHALDHLSAGMNREEKELLNREWECVVGVLDLFTDFFEKQNHSAEQYLELFTLALSRIDLGNVPNTVDHIEFAEVDRVRLQSPRAVFVLGVNEGQFPANGGNTGLFSTREREKLNEAGIELPVSGAENALREQYVLYTALCAPAERLYISYAAGSLQGDTAMEPSALLMRLAGTLAIPLTTQEELRKTDFIVNSGTAKSQWAAHMGEEGAFASTLEALLAAEGESGYLQTLHGTAENAPMGGISSENARAMLGERIRLSPTAIDRFYQCPCRYFCDNMLRLRPRSKVEYSSFESGSAIHYVFEQMVKLHGGKHLIELSDEECDAEIEQFLREYISRKVPENAPVTARFRYQFARLRLMLGIILRHMAEELAQSEFEPAETEVKVGEDGTVVPPVLLTPEGIPISITGSIDRVDLFRAGSESYLRVIDYKSGQKDFRLEEVYYGLNMQMLLYLYAVCDDRTQHFGAVQPAGVLYAPSRLQAVETSHDASEEDVRHQVNTDLRMKGIVLEDEAVLRAMERELAGVYIPASLTGKGAFSKNSKLQSREQFAALRELVYHNVTEMAQLLSQGRVEPLPTRSGKNNPCEYCDYAALCNNSGPDGRCREMNEKEEENE